MSPSGRTVIVALGGNAITPGTGSADVYMQFANTRRSLQGVVDLVKQGCRVVLTHGNGPQIGDKLILRSLSVCWWQIPKAVWAT
jgi:carbamate kinase